MTQVTLGRYDAHDEPGLIWEIVDEGGVAAALHVHMVHRMIMQVEVRSDREGEGLARALYETAAATGEIFHTPVWGCTEEGAGFAAAMGGPVMDDETAAEITGVDLDDLDGMGMV